jgi:hypothetical protein
MRQSLLYAALRPQCPSPQLAIASGGSLAAGSLWIGAVGLNRVGLNRVSSLQQVSWTANQKIQITLPTTIRTAAEEIHRIAIVAATANTPALVQPLCWWRGITRQSIGGGYFEEAIASLPATLELTHPDQLGLGAVVANPTGLAGLTVIEGMTRWMTSLSNLFYYDSTATDTVNGQTVLSAGAAPGRWLVWPFPVSFGLGTISDLTLERGCWRDVRSLLDADVVFPPPAYAMGGSRGPWASYWLCNGTSETGTDITAGLRVQLEVNQNGAPKSQLFDRRLVAQPQGVVRLSDGSLTTAGLSTAQQDYVYGQPAYTLEQDLLPGRGLILRVAPRFRAEELDGYLQTSPLSIKPYFSQQAGNFVTAYRLFGDVVYPDGDRRRVFPMRGTAVRVGGGAGLIKRFEFELRPAQVLTVGETLVSDRKITLNSNGDIFYRGAQANESTEVTRAIVSLTAGRSNPSAASAYQAVGANGALEVTITYPTAIRSTYPDEIAGAGAAQGAEINAPFVCLYVQRQSDGQIREFTSLGVVLGTTQIFQVTSFTAGTVITNLPNTVGDFGLWASSGAPSVAASETGSLAADSYRVHWGFRYDGSTVTAISHSVTSGCVPEMGMSVLDVITQVGSVSNLLATLQDGSSSLDVSNLIARGQAQFWADFLDLNADALGSGANWRYRLQRPAAGMTGDVDLILPANAGQAGQALFSNGPGQALSFQALPSLRRFVLNFDTGSSTTWFTLAAGERLLFVELQVLTQANAVNSVQVGITGDLGKYFPSLFVVPSEFPNTRGVFHNNQPPPTADETILISYVRNGASVGSALLSAQVVTA